MPRLIIRDIRNSKGDPSPVVILSKDTFSATIQYGISQGTFNHLLTSGCYGKEHTVTQSHQEFQVGMAADSITCDHLENKASQASTARTATDWLKEVTALGDNIRDADKLAVKGDAFPSYSNIRENLRMGQLKEAKSLAKEALREN